MSTLQGIGFFVGIPVAFAIIVFVLVSMGSWTRKADDADSGPLMIVSDAAVPDPAELPREIASGITTSYAGGGVSGRW
jgi:hypothetical protein